MSSLFPLSSSILFILRIIHTYIFIAHIDTLQIANFHCYITLYRRNLFRKSIVRRLVSVFVVPHKLVLSLCLCEFMWRWKSWFSLVTCSHVHIWSREHSDNFFLLPIPLTNEWILKYLYHIACLCFHSSLAESEKEYVKVYFSTNACTCFRSHWNTYLLLFRSVWERSQRERERRREAHICLGLCFYGCAGCGWRREMAKNLFHSVCIRLNWGRDTRIPWLRVRESWRKKNNSRSSLLHLVFSPSSLSSVSSVCPSTLASFIHWFNLYIAFSIGYGIVFSAHMHVLLHQKKN